MIKLYSIPGRNEVRSYQAELVVDNTWEEMEINFNQMYYDSNTHNYGTVILSFI